MQMMSDISTSTAFIATTDAENGPNENRKTMTAIAVIECLVMGVAVFGNTMLFILMRSKKMSRHSFSVYFSFAAVFNTLTISWNCLQDTYSLANDIELEEDASRSYKFGCGFLEEFDGWFNLVSAWMMTFLCIDRYISICHPSFAQTFCRRPIAITVCSFVVFSSFIIELPWPLIVPDKADNDPAHGPVLCGDEADNNLNGFNIAEVFISLFIPVIIVTILNVLILVKLNKAKAFRDQDSLTEHGKQQNQNNRLNVSIFYILMCTTVTWLPFSIVVFIDTVNPSNDSESPIPLSYAWHITLVLWLFTFAQDFYVLMVMSPVYRKEMRRQCACLPWCRRVEHERLDINNELPSYNEDTINDN